MARPRVRRVRRKFQEKIKTARAPALPPGIQLILALQDGIGDRVESSCPKSGEEGDPGDGLAISVAEDQPAVRGQHPPKFGKDTGEDLPIAFVLRGTGDGCAGDGCPRIGPCRQPGPSAEREGEVAILDVVVVRRIGQD
jgi:hypothetical protein